MSPIRKRLTRATIWTARRLMPLLVWLAGDRCWQCGRHIAPTKLLSSYHIVEARVWSWNEVICDECIRLGRGRLHR